jgi:hypothetical protein
MTTRPDHTALRDLQIEVDAELTLAESSSLEDGVPAGQWQYDPTEIERQEAGLRNLLGAVRALDDRAQDDPAGRS